MTLKHPIWIAVICAAARLSALDAGSSFTYQTQTANSAATPVSVNATIQLPVTALGSTSAVTFIVNSTDSSPWVISSAQVTGTGFATTGTGTPVPANGTAAFLVTTTPTSAGTSTGTLSITLSGPGGTTVTAGFGLSATAVGGLLVSYTIGANQTLLASGGSLPFPQTQVNTTVSATIILTNRTSIAVNVASVLLLGSSYQLAGLPLFPTSVPAGSQLGFTVNFTPTGTTPAPGTLTITAAGATQTFSLSGQGSAVSFSYTYGTTPIAPGAAIPLGSAALGSTQNHVSVVIQNTGNLSGQISGISVSSTAFTLADLPSFPVNLAPGNNLTFTVGFVPSSVGNLTATLSIGGTTFGLTGTGLGSSLAVAAVVGSQSTPIQAGNTATLPNTSIGKTLAFVMQAQNVGNQPATINALSLVGTSMALVQPPALPLTIPAGGSVSLNCTFTPTSTGIVNGYLQIQSQAFGLTVSADPPPALPAITFVNVTPKMTPLQQPALGLSLAAPYPFDLKGVLTLGFVADALGDDPNVEFVSGSRSVTFKIPANSTQAVFGATATTAPFQTGTTAGTITLSATFALGTYDVTAGVPITQSIAIPEAAPVILSVAIGSESSSGVTLIITGYSTPRSLQGLTFQFTPAIGATLQTTTLTADVSKSFDTWFQSTAGISFGSQFALTVQLSVAGNMSSIISVAVSASNAQGISSPVSLALN